MTAVAVSDPSSPTWSPLVYVQTTFPNGATFGASGVMVGPNDVLTASHVLYMASQGGAATSVTVIPDYDASPYQQPFGQFTSTSFHYFSNYDPTGSGLLMPGDGGAGLTGSELDVGIIDLSTAVGNQTGWMTLDPNFTSGTVNVTGYPAAYGWAMMNDSGFAYEGTPDSIIVYTGVDLSPGNSGGPVWYQAADGEHVVGVVSTAGWGASVQGTYNQLEQWISGNDYMIPNSSSSGSTSTTTTTPPPDTTSTTPPPDTTSTTTTTPPPDTTSTTTTTSPADTTTTTTTTPPPDTTTTTTTDTSSSSTGTSTGGTHAPPAVPHQQVDFYGDGHTDILLHDPVSGQTQIESVDGTVATSTQTTSMYGPPNWAIVGTGDFNGDGHGDIFWQENGGMTAIWTQNGTTTLNFGCVEQGPANAHAAGTGDFNGDGRSDLLWQADNGTLSTWQMNDHTVAGGGTIGQLSSDWHVAGIGDFQGDGHSDVLLRNDNGSVAMWLMNGTAHTGGGTISQPGNDWHISGVGDFDGDGRGDILWHSDSGMVSIWLMNGENIAGGWGSATETVPTNWQIAGTGDFNGDHKADILWQDTSGNLQVELMDGLHSIGHGVVGTLGSDWVVS